MIWLSLFLLLSGWNLRESSNKTNHSTIAGVGRREINGCDFHRLFSSSSCSYPIRSFEFRIRLVFVVLSFVVSTVQWRWAEQRNRSEIDRAKMTHVDDLLDNWTDRIFSSAGVFNERKIKKKFACPPLSTIFTLLVFLLVGDCLLYTSPSPRD